MWLLLIFLLAKFEVSNTLVSIPACLILFSASIYALRNTDFVVNNVDKFAKIRLEFLKVSWASFQASKKTAIMVGVLIALFSIIMWLVDTLFTYVVKNIL